ncbi:MAG: mevalonate kinase [Methanobrevibacter sp.]|uniref:mevalonate kinase n=1 Tax=Methanobrevibacter sp. TaxID=66852 RepID=UPI001B10D595|nr:mevalonate kinase [Methanobrevibacter sp.]MBO5152339.1 mevalonate kinase [Methanobrevibacter sp.]
MRAKASAPAKMILFGEHSVVYSQPAIAGAVNKRAYVEIKPSNNHKSILKSYDLNFEVEMDTRNKSYILKKGKPGIIRYILEAFHRVHDHSPVVMTLSSEIPIGSGLGSSAAVTVATLAALYRYHNIRFNKKSLAHDAHMIEQAVQGVASPLDTLVSTYGGLVYLSRNKTFEPFKVNLNVPFVVGYTTKHGNTGKMVKDVKSLKDRNSKVINPVITSMGHLTNYAKQAILRRDYDKIGELMNINHGFLDVLGVNTPELSRMVYTARECGAIGSKITGAGGGGSIIALCPGKAKQVAEGISKQDNVLKVNFTKRGVSSRVRE